MEVTEIHFFTLPDYHQISLCEKVILHLNKPSSKVHQILCTRGILSFTCNSPLRFLLWELFYGKSSPGICKVLQTLSIQTMAVIIQCSVKSCSSVSQLIKTQNTIRAVFQLASQLIISSIAVATWVSIVMWPLYDLLLVQAWFTIDHLSNDFIKINESTNK